MHFARSRSVMLLPDNLCFLCSDSLCYYMHIYSLKNTLFNTLFYALFYLVNYTLFVYFIVHFLAVCCRFLRLFFLRIILNNILLCAFMKFFRLIFSTLKNIFQNMTFVMELRIAPPHLAPRYQSRNIPNFRELLSH